MIESSTDRTRNSAKICIEELRRLARHLWNTEPACESHLRTSLLSRLAHLEYELERLHYGKLQGRHLERSDLEGLRAELAELRTQWQTPMAAA